MTNLARAAGPLPITWAGPMLNLSGYASEMRSFVTGLQERGHVVRAVSMDPNREFVGRSGPEILGSAATALRASVAPGGLVVQHVPGFAVRRTVSAALVVARTMFETDSLPPSWVNWLNQVDEVWVPTAFNRETFTAAGVRVPIAVVPGGIETDRYHPGVVPLPAAHRRSVSYLSVFEWTRRKAVELLLSAWVAAFGPDDDVELVLRTYPRGSFRDPGAEIERRLDEQLALLGTTRDRVAPIRIVHGALAEEDMPRLYAGCNVFVLPTRGEGWGRPYLEAMACGKPVIATDWSAHTDFVDDSVGWMLQSNGLVPAAEDLAGAAYDGQNWADPSVEHLTELLRTTAADPDERARRGAAAASRARQWTWEQAVDVVEDRIAALDRMVTGPVPAPGGTEATQLDAQPVRILWRGDVLGSHSFARINRETLTRLVDDPRFEIAVRTDEPVTQSPWTDPRTAALARLVGRELSGPADVELRHSWPPNLTESDAGAVVLQQPWEFGGLPRDIAGFARRRDEHQPAGADEVWVPTTFVRDGYRDSGVPGQRIQVVPHGVDLDVYHPQGPRRALDTDKRVRLLFVGGTIWRKGIDLLLDAYAATFTAADDVCLVVKASLSSTFYRGSNTDARIRAMAASPDGPAIELIEDDLDDAGLAAVYRACDALVHPFRGEGFAMTIIEAMACGLPVVTTGAGAVLDLVDETTAVLLPATRRPIELGDDNPYGPFVYLPDGDALRAALLQVVADSSALQPQAVHARQVVEQRFTWDSVAAQVADRLLALHAAAGPVPGGELEPLPLDSERSLRLVVDAPMPTPRGQHVLRRYLRTYSARDDVCLAFPLYGDAERDAEVFEQICADLGLDDGATADVLLVPAQGSGSTRALLSAGDVVLTGGDSAAAALASACSKPAFAWPEQVRDLVSGQVG